LGKEEMDMGEMTHPSAAKVEGRSTFDKQMLNAFSIMFRCHPVSRITGSIEA
jgi:hypothetical protein